MVGAGHASGTPRTALLGLLVVAAVTLLLLLPAGSFGRAVAPPYRLPAPAPSGACLAIGACRGGTPAADGGVELPQWHLLPSGSHGSPSARSGASAAFDAPASVLVLFGGRTSAGQALGDTWEFVRGSWQLVPLTGATPSPRWGAVLTFDAAAGRLVLFGGENATAKFGDTWTFNGSAWRLLSAASAPSPRAEAASAYDPGLQGVVLFGGDTGALSPANDTWLFTGGVWRPFPALGNVSPPPLAGPAMAYDPSSTGLLLVGAPDLPNGGAGPVASAWSLLGSVWSPLTPSGGSSPAARTDASLITDPATSAVVLFSGLAPGSATPTGDTWTLAAGGWTNDSGLLRESPSARDGAAAAFDPQGAGVLLFGGATGATALGDTWSYSAVPMSLSVTVSPTAGEAPLNATFQVVVQGGTAPYVGAWSFGDGAPRSGTLNATHVYDAVGSYVATVTVNDSAGATASTTVPIQVLTPWQAGHQWGELSVAASRAPSPRWAVQATYDPPISAGLVFGGALASGGALGDTWVFVDGVWINLTANLSVAPSPRWGGAMAFDPTSGSVVLFGGTNGTTTFNDTWTYSPAVGWQRIPTDTAPSARLLAGFIDDAAMGGDVLFGGGLRGSGGSWTIYNDTWEWSNGAWMNRTASLVRGPPPTLGAAISYDTATGELDMFGGSALPPGGTPGTCYPDAELWVLDQGQWTLSTAADPPTNRLLSVSAYLPSDGVSLVFGGAEARDGSCGAGSDTWGFANSTWSNLSSSIDVTPPSRSAASAMYDAATGVLVLFGGDENGVALNDTWVYPARLNQSATVSVQQVFAAGSINHTGGTSGGGPSGTGGGASNFTVGYTISGGGTNAPDTLQFAATETGGLAPFTVTWYFGDSSPTVSGANVTHTYSVPGSFEAVLTVVDATGQRVVQLVGPILVQPPLPGDHGPASVGPPSSGLSWVFPALGAAGIAVVAIAILVELRQRRLRREGDELVREIEESKNP